MTMESLEATASKLHELADSVIEQSAGLNNNAVIKEKVDQVVAFYNDKIKSYMELLDSDKEVIDELHARIRALEEQQTGSEKAAASNVNELLQQEKRNRLQTEEQSISITTQQEETINRLEAKLKQQEDIIQQYQHKLKEAGIPFHCQPSVKHLAPTPRSRAGTVTGSTDGNLTRNSFSRESSLLSSQTAPTTPLLSAMDRTFGSTQSGPGTPRAGSAASAFQSTNFTPTAGGYRSTPAADGGGNSSLANKLQHANGGASMPGALTGGEPAERIGNNLKGFGMQTFDTTPAIGGQQPADSNPQSRSESVESNSRPLGVGGANYFNASSNRLSLPQSRSGSGDGLRNHSAVPLANSVGSSPSLQSSDSLSGAGRVQVPPVGQITPRNQSMQAQILADPVSSFMKEIQQLRVNSAMNTPRAEVLPSSTSAGLQPSVNAYQRVGTPRGMVNFNSVVPPTQPPTASTKSNNLDAVSSFLEDVRTSLDTLNNESMPQPTAVSATAKFKSLIGDSDIRGIAAQAAPTRNTFDTLGGARDFAVRRN